MGMKLCSWLYRRLYYVLIKLNILYILSAVAMCLITYKNYTKPYKLPYKLHNPLQNVRLQILQNSRIPSIVKEETIPISDGQDTIDYIAEYLEVKVKVIENRAWIARIEIKLKNTGLSVISSKAWNIYFNQPESLVLPDNTENKQTNSVVDHASGFLVTNVRGTLYSIQPDNVYYKAMHPKNERTFTLEFAGTIIAKTGFFPNWYVTSSTFIPKVLESTKSETLNFVEEFRSREQWQRGDNDQYDPYEAKFRFQMNEKNTRDLERPGSDVIPTLYEVRINKEDPHILINADEWCIVVSEKFEAEAKYLSDKLSIKIQPNPPQTQFIHITELATNAKFLADEYLIQFRKDDEVVRLIADDKSGAFYGIQTLLTLIQRIDIKKYRIPSRIDVRDRPRFPYRGIQLDVSRNFMPKDTVMKFIDVMSIYKLNKLHLHLTDNEGWRLEIPGLEELTKTGATRCHDLLETDCLLPQHGSGPHNTTFGSGYYTVADYQDILRFAASRHVQIIPEINIPGHSRAAIKAMLQRKRVSKSRVKGEEFILHEKGDRSDYRGRHNFNDGTINVCLESTYIFMKTVISEIKTLHEDIQPLTMIHIGGNEVSKGSWDKSSECRNLRSRHSIPDLKLYLLDRLFQILAENKIKAGVWEDGVIPSFERVSPYHPSKLGSKFNYSGDIYTYAYDNVWENSKASRAYNLANSGYKVVMSQATHLYLDHPYEPDPEERGLSWATRYTDTQKIFNFLPTDLYANADTDLMGIPIQPETKLCSGKEGCNLFYVRNIVGMEAQLFTEVIRTPEQLFYMAFPRILAVAERSWHKASWEELHDTKMQSVSRLEDWLYFSNTLGHRELRRLDKMAIPYRIPPPGAILSDRILEVNVEFPGLTVEYSKDGGHTWTEVKRLVGPGGSKLCGAKVYTNNNVLVRTLSADKLRHSRIVTVHNENGK